MNRPNHVSKVLIDGDIVAYRSAAATQEKPFSECADAISTLMEYIVEETVIFRGKDNVKTFLTSKNNFRYDLAKTYPYKGNRSKDRPEHLETAKKYLEDHWGAETLNGFEADDAIAMSVKDPETTVIASIDKDFRTIPCWMFNFSKTGSDKWIWSTTHDSLLYFYEQLLTGDNADNIKGLYRVGPKTAQKVLDGAMTEHEMFYRTLTLYEEKCKDGIPLDRLVENANLLHLRRHVDDVWVPPTERT